VANPFLKYYLKNVVFLMVFNQADYDYGSIFTPLPITYNAGMTTLILNVINYILKIIKDFDLAIYNDFENIF
jgi:hypothetical protein